MDGGQGEDATGAGTAGQPTGQLARRLLAAATVTVAAAAAVAALLLGDAAARPALLAAAAPAPAPPARLASLPPGTTQAVLVDSADPSATDATVSAWSRTPTGWTAFLPPTRAFLGRAGMGPSSEGASRTPAGTFGITRAFGRLPSPGTALPYADVGPDDWWVSDPASPLYNTHQVCAPGRCPFDERRGENLQAMGHAYDRAIVIDANTAPVRPGAGSAYFLHIGDHPTAGCVATDQGTVEKLLRWLDPGAKPQISLAS